MKKTLVATITLLLSTQAQAQMSSFSGLVKEVAPSVVNINVEQSITVPAIPGFSPFRDLDNRNTESAGSGFIIKSDGLIVTNNHVIQGATKVEVETTKGTVYQATVIATDPITDIAIIDIDGDDHPIVPFGNSDAMEVGDWVIAVGNPLGQGFSVSAGIVSARERMLSGAFDDYIQTDAAINKGNSGGPLFNMDGEVIGINTAILSPNGGSVGLGFSMSSNVAQRVIEQLMEYGQTRRGWMGVRIQPLTNELRESMQAGTVDGVLLTEIIDGPAQEAGLMAGDIITRIDSKIIDSPSSLTRSVGNLMPGQEISVTYIRNGQQSETTLTLGAREEAEQRIAGSPMEGNTVYKGVTFGLETDDSSTTKGVIVQSLANDSPFTGILEEGDVIIAVNRLQARTPEDVVATLVEMNRAGRTSTFLQILRDNQVRFITMPL